MKKIREVLRLAFGVGFALRKIERSMGTPRDGVELRHPGAGGRPVVAERPEDGGIVYALSRTRVEELAGKLAAKLI